MKKFDIRLVKKHLLFDYEGKVVLVDTGAPVSFMRGSDDFEFMGRNYSCNPVVMDDYIPEASQFVGEDIDVMMGTDILSHYRFVVDYPGKTLTLYEPDEAVPGQWDHRQELYSAQDGHIGMHVLLDGRPACVALDTGAIIQYLDKSFTSGITPVESAKDFHHMTGEFTTGIYPLEMEADDDRLEMQFGNLPHILQMPLSFAGFDGVIGWDFFSSRKVFFDIHNHFILWNSRIGQ